MPKKSKKVKQPGRSPGVVAQTTVNQVFLGDGAEPLTDTVIAELVAAGWPEKDLLFAARAGARYSRPRNSLIFPPEFG